MNFAKQISINFRNSYFRIIFLFLAIFLLLFIFVDFSLAKKCESNEDCPKMGELQTMICKEGKCVKALEITYPKIGGEGLQETVKKEGLPGYVTYIFKLAVTLIGLVIFGVLIYNGIIYMISTGSPEKMGEARTGIFYAFLGGLLLLFSVIIFNTINPQLKIMNLLPPEPLEQVVLPGIYICNYKVDNIDAVLRVYIKGRGDEQIEAAKKLRKIMWKPQEEQGCPVINFSGPFQNFKLTKNSTIFTVPAIFRDPKNRDIEHLEYEYGIVLHEKDNFGGRCYLPYQDQIYSSDSDIKTEISLANLEFTARSVTLFKKPAVEPEGDGVTLYENFNYNREAEGKSSLFKPDRDFKKIGSEELDELKENARSISFSPEGSYLTLVYGKEAKKCRVLHQNDPDIMDTPIGMCGGVRCWHWVRVIALETPEEKKKIDEICAPCLRSMIVIKGGKL